MSSAWLGLALLMTPGCTTDPLTPEDGDGGRPVDSLRCELARVSDAGEDRVVVTIANQTSSPIEFLAAETPFEWANPGFVVRDSRGQEIAPGFAGYSSDDVVRIEAGASVSAWRPLDAWALETGESYLVSLGTQQLRGFAGAAVTEWPLNCGVVAVDGPGEAAAVAAPLRADEGCAADERDMIERASPLVLSGVHLALGRLTTRDGTFRRWFGGSGAHEADSIDCIRGYLNQIESDYANHEIQCHNSCCGLEWLTNPGGCTWLSGFDLTISLCSALLDDPAPAMTSIPGKSLVGTLTHELGHAVGAGHGPNELCGGGDGACNTTSGALLLAQQPRTVTQWCDNHLPVVWASVNNATTLSKFVQEILGTTAAIAVL